MISEQLAGKRIAITGATGFLGTALVERLMRSVPGCEIVCIVRPQRRYTPIQRIHREVIKNDCFDRLREELGPKFDAEVEKRVSAIAGDVSSDELGLDAEGLAVMKTCDVVIHSAATVSFESPIDMAVEVNLLGPFRVAQAIKKSDSLAHLVAVSTAYVSGSRRGEAYEELITESWYTPDLEWKKEVAAGRRAAADAENDSRQIAQLEAFGKQAQRELGSAGTPLIAERTEKLRLDWVKQQLIDKGKARAQSLGYPDVYAFTKSLGERCLLEERGDIPVSFVRPSIIESALLEPKPGWIRGFRMAEPILLGVGKGILKSFPGLPEGVFDVIPVDKVVACIIAVAASKPDVAKPPVFQIASGTRQPLRYRDVVSLVTDYYREHPLYDTNGLPIPVKADEWDYPTRGEAERQLRRAIWALDSAERVLQVLPLRGRPALISAKLEEQRSELARTQGYLEIYGAYTNSEALFRIDRTLELFESLDDDDKKQFHFDPIDIDWHHYLHDIHMPSVIEQGRVRTSPGKRVVVDKAANNRKAILNDQRQLAVFDFENTLMRFKVTEGYAWLATRHLTPFQQAKLAARKLPSAPWLYATDRKDRGDFLRQLYRWYGGAEASELQSDAHELFADLLVHRLYPEAIERVLAHKAAGHRTLLMTGHLDFIVEPLRPLFDDIVSAHIVDEDGILSGELQDSPPVGEARALYLREYSKEHGVELANTVAYADAVSDLPMLAAVGYPVAVNPETKLAGIARRRGWHTELWERGDQATDETLEALGLVSAR